MLFAVSPLHAGSRSMGYLLIDLVSFDAACDNGEVSLSWVTRSERGFDEFVVQHSLDGIAWSDAGRVAPEQNAGGSAYSFQHSPASPGISYYRLLVRGSNDLVAFSDLVAAECVPATPGSGFFPNPASNAVEINLAGWRGDALFELLLFDPLGAAHHLGTVNAGTLTRVALAPGIKDGVYSVVLSGNGEQFQLGRLLITGN